MPQGGAERAAQTNRTQMRQSIAAKISRCEAAKWICLESRSQCGPLGEAGHAGEHPWGLLRLEEDAFDRSTTAPSKHEVFRCIEAHGGPRRQRGASRSRGGLRIRQRSGPTHPAPPRGSSTRKPPLSSAPVRRKDEARCFRSASAASDEPSSRRRGDQLTNCNQGS